MKIPFGVAANNSTVFYTDWVSMELGTGSVTSYDLVTKETQTLLRELSNPAGVVYINRAEPIPAGRSRTFALLESNMFLFQLVHSNRSGLLHCGDTKAQFTQDAEYLAKGVHKFWNTLWSIGVFRQVASNIKGFACKSAFVSCVNEA